MESNGQIPKIIKYITEHPGSFLVDITRATGVPTRSATPVLCNLTKAGVLRREGVERRYRYYAVNPEERPVIAPKKRHSYASQSTVNPLTNLFNQRLAQVRGGR